MRGWVLCLAGLLLGAVEATAQVAPVDEPAVCYECHSEVQEQARGPHVHTAFRTGKCSSCHNPHAGRHAALLNEEIGELCLSCHGKIREEGRKAASHPPVTKGLCRSCHHPHASGHANLLPKSVLALCKDCHSQTEGWTAQRVVHGPVAQGKCFSCHDAHGSDHDGMLKKSVPTLCFQCHTQNQAYQTAHRGYDVSQSNCVTCHDPHASSLAGLQRPNRHAPFAGGDCTVCHASSGQSGSFALKGTVKDLCLKCHRKVGDYEKAARHHLMNDPTSCVQCHNPHASATTALLQAEQKHLCMRCHFNEPDRREKSAYATHDGMDCGNCHLPHGGDREKLFARDAMELCKECHEHAHRVSHPVGLDVIDPRTGEAVTCLSCHKLHGSEFEDYLPLNPDRELCVRCHRR